MKHRPDIHALHTLLFIIMTLAVAACASMGRPEGGPLDETPPVYVRSNPAPGQLNVNRDRIVIEFNENVQLDDPSNKIVVSPTQKYQPKVTSAGRRVIVNLQDTLLPDATYTIDFTDAIKDLNEGNILDGFALDFATGSAIDTLRISGMVLEAATLEPAQGMLVGVHSNLSDTAITKLPFERVTKTNQLGQFTIRNLPHGTYRIFAINDVNRDNRWDRSEDIAFYPVPITPSARTETHLDTLRATDGSDSIVSHSVTVFEPNDVLLTWFNEKYSPLYLKKYERPESGRLVFEFSAPLDTLPSLKVVGGPFDGRDITKFSRLNASSRRDSLEYWFTDTAMINRDSLKVALTYLRTDTAERIVWGTDTLNLNFRRKRQSAKKPKVAVGSKDIDVPMETSKASVEARSDSDSTANTQPKIELLTLRNNTPSPADVYSRLRITTAVPVASFDTSAVHMQLKVDTMWVDIEKPLFHLVDTLNPMLYEADNELEPGAQYRVIVDSMAVTAINGLYNGTTKFDIQVRKLSDYATLTMDISGLPDSVHAVAQLVTREDRTIASAPVEPNHLATFRHILPGTYYARLFVDANNNSLYDNGSYTDSIQPEDTYYYPKKITLRKNWDIQQSWNVSETPVDLQKPNEIKKNKPKVKNNPDAYNTGNDDEDQYYDEFGNPAVDPDDPFGKRKNSNYNRRNNRTTTPGSASGYRNSSTGLLR